MVVDSVALLLALLAVRTVVLRVLPTTATSDDVQSWLTVMRLLAHGQDPYTATKLLNWPPFWLQILYVLGWISRHLHVDPIRAGQGALVTAEFAFLMVLYPLLRRDSSRTTSVMVVALGWILNPVAIILTCVQGNFDVFVGLWVLMAAAALARWHRSGEVIDWIAAVTFAGLGALAKTTPLILGPVLAAPWRRLSARVLGMGALAFFGPIVLGMSVIFVLGPAGVVSHVLEYRSQGGYFGISGILDMTGHASVNQVYGDVFLVLLVTAAVLVGWCVQHGSGPRGLSIYAGVAALLLAVPGLGPGYGGQYIEWGLPVLLIVLARSAWRVRAVVLVFMSIAALTYMVEYAVGRHLGAYLTNSGIHVIDSWASFLGVPAGATLSRLPLFAAYLVLLLTLATVVGRARSRRVV